MTLMLALDPDTNAANHEDLASIATAVRNYIDGTRFGDPDLVEDVFLSNLVVQWLDEDNKLRHRSGPDCIARIRIGEEVPRNGRIVAIDATDKSAMVKVGVEWNDKRYTDYMLLLKVEGAWRIVSKVVTWTKK